MLSRYKKIYGDTKQAKLAKVTMFAVGNANEPIGVSPYAEKYSAP